MSNKELNALFSEWKQKYPKYKGKFISDGIIDEDEYNLANKKILFIAKEANSPNQSAGDFRTWWPKGVRDNFSYRLCEWAYGILKDFPPLEDMDKDRASYIKKIAFMNLKKIGGGSTVDYKALSQVVTDEAQFIKRQIDIIRPQIIVGGVGREKYWTSIFNGIQFNPSKYDVKIARYGEYRIIHFYHPSYRVPRAMSYSLLEKVFNSEAFNKL